MRPSCIHAGRRRERCREDPTIQTMIIEQDKRFKGEQEWFLVNMNIVMVSVSPKIDCLGFLHFPRLI